MNNDKYEFLAKFQNENCYVTHCACYCDHFLYLGLDYDEDNVKYITIASTEIATWNDYSDDLPWYKQLALRIKTAWQILRYGYLEQRAGFVAQGDAQIEEMIDIFTKWKQAKPNTKEESK